MSVTVELSYGELLDKITILEIKQEKISDSKKLSNIKTEYQMLSKIWVNIKNVKSEDMTKLRIKLKRVNEQLWKIEDDIRLKEKQKTFDNDFIELARSVYFTNDVRAKLKHEINILLGSYLVEEKSYENYQ